MSIILGQISFNYSLYPPIKFTTNRLFQHWNCFKTIMQHELGKKKKHAHMRVFLF